MLETLDDYYWIMAARGRLIAVDNGQTALCTFFMLEREEEIPRFYDRTMWSTPQDTPSGTLLYIDKLISKSMTPKLFRQLEACLTEHVPQWERAVWYRPGHDADRRYTLLRRRSECQRLIPSSS